jgi:predicted permease
MLRYTPERSRQYWSEVTRRLEALPGVTSVALASRLPFSLNFNRTNIAVPGQQKSADEMGTSINSAIVSPAYFATLGIGVLHGRAFAETDTPDQRRVAVVSEAFAMRYWPNESAVGRVVYERTLDSGRALEIVGVVATHALQNVGEAPQPAIYFATTQRPSGYNVVFARTEGDDTALLTKMRETLVTLEPQLLLLDNQTMKAQIQAMLFPVRVAAALVSVFSGLGLLLAAVGLYGIIAYAVAQRTREIGIRMAIGARQIDVARMIMRRGMALTAAGMFAGIAASLALSQLVRSQLFGVQPSDPVTMACVLALMTLVAGAAAYVPARRAARVDPVGATRERRAPAAPRHGGRGRKSEAERTRRSAASRS